MVLNLSRKIGLLILISARIKAQEINTGARITALGNTGVSIQDVWSMQANQAGIAAIENAQASISYQNNYLHTDLSTKSAVAVLPFKKNVLGLSFQNYGVSAYSEQRIGLAYAKRFGKTFFAAINLNAHQVRITQYGSAQTFSAEAGIQFKPFPKILIGSHIANPNKSSYNKQVDAKIPTLLQIGASYLVSDKVTFSSELVKDLDWLTDARFGLEYNMMGWLSLRGGFNVNPFRQFAGVGTKYQKIRLDIASSSHPVLGYSPQMSLGYEF